MRTECFAISAAVACVLATAPALAAVNLQTTVSERTVEVGETFYVKLSALSDRTDQAPSNPTLAVPQGIAVHGPSVGSQTQMTITNGQMQQRVGLNATWQLTATRPGKYRIGPASVEAGGARAQGEVIVVEVVPAGTKPRRALPGNQPFDPFDLFDRMRGGRRFPGFGFNFDLDEPQEEPELPAYPEEFRVDAAKDPIAFLRATLTPRKVVIGEQVTLRVYAYGSRGPFGEAHLSTEPSRGDFVGYQLGDRSDRELYRVPIGDTTWFAAKVREYALFPLRSGTLEAGAMKFGFNGPRYANQGGFQGLVRTCEPASVVVTEPPLQGRPPGYKLGDVGDYELTAKVEPRELVQGESVSVIAKLEGVGNVPAKLRLPERRGIAWGEPSMIDKVEPNGDVIQGYRVFTYVVRIDEAGKVDLGELTLPHWNPKKKAYEVARAVLGEIQVKPNPKLAREPESKSERDPLREALSVRAELGAPAQATRHLADRPWFWALLVAGPLGVITAGAGSKLFARLRERARARRHAHETVAAEALRGAASAAAQGDGAATASAVERAVFTTIEGASGLKARAVLKDELARALCEVGYAEDLAKRTEQLLKDCDVVRFTGDTETSGARELAAQAAEIVQRLRKSAGQRSRVAS